MSAQSRPQSRASTTSVASQHNDESSMFMSQDAKQSHAPLGPEAALLQYGASMIAMPQEYRDTLPQQQVSHHLTQSASFPTQNMPLSHESPYVQPQDVGYGNSVRLGSVPVQSGTDMTDEKRRKGSAVTATNDKELREMLAKNEGRPLREVAQEVIQKERTPMAEKTKQLFAMLWLRAVCKPAKTSVPRNRVYSQYANRCGTERVVPLNPASFGKLVRVIFPGIQTRRLGVRGESKYHYVDLALDDENSNPITNPNWHAQFGQSDGRARRSESASTQQIDFNNIPRLQADTAAFPAIEGGFDFHPPQPPTPRGPPSHTRSFAYPDSRGLQPGAAESMTYPHTLRFPPSNLPTFSENEAVNLPPIQPYLPQRTDTDTAEALYALYRTHCTSLIDSIRFCKEKQFFRLYTSFHGTLTVPVQKLFTHPNLARWIEQCDLIMYRTMVRFVSRLTLQAAPVIVINILSNISATLHAHISKTFSTQPSHVLEAKLRPATVFAGLLHRLIRVNQSAHAAANLLTIDQNREQMWREWITMVNPKRVMEAELPDCGYEETYKIMTTEMRSLLEPLNAPAYNDDPYGFSAYNFEENGAFAQFLQNQTGQPGSRSGPSQVSTENVLDRWSGFITSLPSRFPQAPARTLLHCISTIGTAALRDITIMNGLSYGHWWVLKIFVDEMALWLAEMGGFLEPDPAASPQNGGGHMQQSPVLENGTCRSSHSGSRMSSSGPDATSRNGHHHQPQQQQQQQQHFYDTNGHGTHQQQAYAPPSTTHYANGHGMQNLPFHPEPRKQPHQPQPQHHHQLQQHQDTDLEDSGIGMSLVGEEDLTMTKFGATGPHVATSAAGMGMGTADMRVEPL